MKQLTLTSLFVLASPFLMIMGFIMMFFCDGALWPLQFIFPVSALTSYLFPTDIFLGNLYLLFLIAILQFPLYGLAVDLLDNKKRAALFVALFHVGVFIYTMVIL